MAGLLAGLPHTAGLSGNDDDDGGGGEAGSDISVQRHQHFQQRSSIAVAAMGWLTAAVAVAGAVGRGVLPTDITRHCIRLLRPGASIPTG